MEFLKEFFEKSDFKKNQQTTKKHAILPIKQNISFSGGPCLVHTLNGDLLRSLDPPEGSPLTANLITMSRETFVIVKFDEGVICNFSINGRLQKHIKHKDNIQVCVVSENNQGSHLEKYLNLEGFLEKSLKIKSALKST